MRSTATLVDTAAVAYFVFFSTNFVRLRTVILSSPDPTQELKWKECKSRCKRGRGGVPVGFSQYSEETLFTYTSQRPLDPSHELLSAVKCFVSECCCYCKHYVAVHRITIGFKWRVSKQSKILTSEFLNERNPVKHSP